MLYIIKKNATRDKYHKKKCVCADPVMCLCLFVIILNGQTQQRKTQQDHTLMAEENMKPIMKKTVKLHLQNFVDPEGNERVSYIKLDIEILLSGYSKEKLLSHVDQIKSIVNDYIETEYDNFVLPYTELPLCRK